MPIFTPMIRLRYYFLAAMAAMALMIASCTGGGDKKDEPATEDVSADVPAPSVIPYVIVNVYPHDPTAFTEGLEYRDGFIYESTGHYGTSELKKTDPVTGKILHSVKLEDRYFGEGLTILGNKIYQLTYQEHTGFVYDLATMKRLRSFTVATEEAWGLTNDSTHLIYGDGTSNLYFLDPETFREVKRIQVHDQYGPVNNVNELEHINGFIYANQWQTDNILKIDPSTGSVAGIADLRTLRMKLGLPDLRNAGRDGPEVLNGIAYDAAANRIFITGKYWPHLVEIKLDN